MGRGSYANAGPMKPGSSHGDVMTLTELIGKPASPFTTA